MRDENMSELKKVSDHGVGTGKTWTSVPRVMDPKPVEGPISFTPYTTDNLLIQIRQWANEARRGHLSAASNLGAAILELDERMMASNQPPSDWKV